MMKSALLFLAFLFLSLSLLAQGGPVSATASKSKIYIGEPFDLQLKATLPRDGDAGWFEIDTIIHFEILNRAKYDTQSLENAIVVSQILHVTSWDSGRWTIPAFSIGKLKTKPLVVDVSFSPFDRNQPYHDIKDIIEVEGPEDSKWIWYLIGILLLTVLFLLFFPRGKKKEAALPRLVIHENFYKITLERLKKLKASGVEKEDVKQYYSQLVNIFREYLEKQRRIRSFSRTTDELSVKIASLNLEKDLETRLTQVLRLSDVVKFARYAPTGEENRDSINIIYESVNTIEELP
jgi:hypothetical protein